MANQGFLEGSLKRGLCISNWLSVSSDFNDGSSQQLNLTKVLVDTQPYLFAEVTLDGLVIKDLLGERVVLPIPPTPTIATTIMLLLTSFPERVIWATSVLVSSSILSPTTPDLSSSPDVSRLGLP